MRDRHPIAGEPAPTRAKASGLEGPPTGRIFIAGCVLDQTRHPIGHDCLALHRPLVWPRRSIRFCVRVTSWRAIAGHAPNRRVDCAPAFSTLPPSMAVVNRLTQDQESRLRVVLRKRWAGAQPTPRRMNPPCQLNGLLHFASLQTRVSRYARESLLVIIRILVLLRLVFFQ